MKNYILAFSIMVFICFFSCKKKEVLDSRVVKIPSIALIGNPVYSTRIASEGTYIDPGAKITDESANDYIILTVPTVNNVDLTTPGEYSVSYTYLTKYGYELSATRAVLVTSASDAVDLSGSYVRSINGAEVTVTITKVGTGLYKTDNVGGVLGRPEFIYDIFFGFTDDSTLVIPEQKDPLGGSLYGAEESFLLTPTSTELQWKVMSINYGPGLRSFLKK